MRLLQIRRQRHSHGNRKVGNSCKQRRLGGSTKEFESHPFGSVRAFGVNTEADSWFLKHQNEYFFIVGEAIAPGSC